MKREHSFISNFKLIAEVLVFILLFSAVYKAVSYTHLDVYKRQVFDVTALNLQQWGIVAVLSFIPVLFVEFEKKILK